MQHDGRAVHSDGSGRLASARQALERQAPERRAVERREAGRREGSWMPGWYRGGLLAVALALLAVAGRSEGRFSPGGEPSAEVERLLERLDEHGQTLREFVAQVALSESDASTGLGSVRTGVVRYQSAGAAGSPRLRVSFVSRAEDDGPPRAERLEYLLDGSWLTERNYRRKAEVRRQVVRPGQTLNLFRLGEGPFPLPIGQKPQDVHRQFEVSRLEGEANALRLVPREGTRLWSRFATIDVWVDEQTGFPVKIETLNRQETTVRTTVLSDLKLNPPEGLPADAFVLEPVDDTWKRTEEAFDEG